MATPPVDLTRTNTQWIRVQTRDGMWCNMRREAVHRALHNTQIGESPTAIWLGWRLDESDCQALLSAMDRGQS